MGVYFDTWGKNRFCAKKEKKIVQERRETERLSIFAGEGDKNNPER